MDINNVRFRVIFYHLFSESPLDGSIFLYAFDIDQLIKFIQHNKQYQIILVCKAERVAELYNILIEPYITEIFIFGDCTKHNIQDKKITTINTDDEQELKFQILCTAMRYTHDEQIIQRQMENHGIANLLATDILKLLNQLETLTISSTKK
jgi:hypothetical protein